MPRGQFITLEGGEGAGKSTQIKHLHALLNEHSIATTLTREPGGTDAAESIRELLVTGEPGRWLPVSEAMLMMTARYEHVMTKIQPELEQGRWVLCDRFFDSTRVYQGIARELGDDWLQMLYRILLGNVKPDLTLYLDIEPKTGLARTASRGGNETRFESLPLSFHQTVRDGFLQLAKAEPSRIIVIDASQSPNEVHQSIVHALNQSCALSLSPMEIAA